MRGTELRTVIAVAVLLASMAVVYALTSVSVRLDNVVSVKALGVGVYWDSGCNRTTSSINWGLANPGTGKNVTVYIRNEGNAPITLSLQTADVSPANAVDYFSLNWSYSSQTISPKQVLAVILSLSISSSIEIASFSFTIIISAIG